MSEKKKHLVMIVDDDDLLLDMYSIKFKSDNFEVMKITSSTDCLRELRDGITPDVILVDMVMPDMTGNDLLKTIREEKLSPKSKIFVLSNQSQTTEIEEAKKYNIDGYIIKADSTPSQVLAKVESVIN